MVLPELLGHVSEMDSDMADITQEPTVDGLLEEGDFGSPVALEQQLPEPDSLVSASSHIPSSLGINPHTLQVLINLHAHIDTFHGNTKILLIIMSILIWSLHSFI